jgi:hypothetical protein
LVVVALGLGAGVGEALLKEEGVEVGEEGERKGEVNRSEVKCPGAEGERKGARSGAVV